MIFLQLQTNWQEQCQQNWAFSQRQHGLMLVRLDRLPCSWLYFRLVWLTILFKLLFWYVGNGSAENQLTGTLPTELGSLTDIMVIDFGTSGEIVILMISLWACWTHLHFYIIVMICWSWRSYKSINRNIANRIGLSHCHNRDRFWYVRRDCHPDHFTLGLLHSLPF